MNLFKKKNGAEASETQTVSTAKSKRKFDKRSLANGSFAAGMAAVIIAAIVVINMIVGALPSDVTTFDMSTNKIFTIGDTTKEVLSSLNEDVTLNYLIQSGKEDTRIQTLLNSYEAASDHVKVKKIDVVANPTFYQQYTDAAVPPNSVIVTAGDKSKVIDNYSIYLQDYSSYQYSFDGEGQLTSAIAYVAGGDTSKAYTVSGHNEIALSANMTDLLEKSSITTEDLNLLAGDVPEDCDLLIIFAPETDFTADEAKKVTRYLADGGKALIVSVGASDNTPNFDSILAAYGVSRIPGFVVEGDTTRYTQAPYILLPEVASTDVTEKVTGLNIVDAFAQAINISTDDDNLTYTATPLLTTSADAFAKDLDTQTLDKEDGDAAGTFTLGVKIEQTYSKDSNGEADVDLEGDEKEEEAEEDTPHTKILYYTSPCLFSSDALSSLLQMYVEIPEGNNQLFSDSITYLTDREVTVSIPAKSMQEPSITVPEGTAAVIGNVLMFGLPAIALIAGIVITLRRRSK